MKRKILSLVLSAVMCLSALGLTAAAQEPDRPNRVSEAEVEAVLRDAGMMGVSPRAVGYVTNFAELEAALADSNNHTIIVLADIPMTKALEIKHDVTLIGISDVTLMATTAGEKHFTVPLGVDTVRLEFSKVILDGENIGGGIHTRAKNTYIENLTLKNVLSGQNGTVPAALYCTEGNLYLTNSQVIDCEYMNGGVINIYSNSSVTVEVKNSLVTGNIGSHGAGLAFVGTQDEANPSFLTIENSVFSHNTSSAQGGALGLSAAIDVKLIGTEFSYNQSTASSGGAVAMMKNGHDGNILVQDCFFTNNTARGNGGAIQAVCPVQITPGTVFTANTSGMNGGAISMIDFGGGTNNLEKLNVSDGVEFSGNTAASGFYMTDTSDIALHAQKILATYFSSPFTQYGYNNYDIAYTKGRELGKTYITFYLKQSDPTIYAEIEASPGDVITLPAPPTLAGFTFFGWVDESGNLFHASTPVTGSLNLYPLWLQI